MIWVHFMEVVLYVWKAKRVHPQGIYHVILCALYPEKACVYSKAYKWVLLFCENITDLLRRMQFSSGWDPYAKAGRKEMCIRDRHGNMFSLAVLIGRGLDHSSLVQSFF